MHAPASRLINNSGEKQKLPQSTIILAVWNYRLQKFELKKQKKTKEEKLRVAYYICSQMTTTCKSAIGGVC